ncbi:hypothetical protein ACIA74_41115 [Streptomyces sp. NPDC051658]|uniref:hypothetical protein n=1 Tax=Streptomyces sp. NPDC051658 TaxID=3365667 RepID=UPI003797074F
MNPSIKRAVLGIPNDAWQQIRYPTAVPDPETGELISDAEVAEIPEYTAFASRTKTERVTARLIVRRVRDLAKPAVVGEQGELFPAWRYHPFFTDQPAAALRAEREHRHHAVVEQVIADSKAGALAHLPSGHFHANAAWLTLWTMTYNLLRPQVPWPRRSIPRPPPPPSGPIWSRFRPGSRDPHDASPCICHTTGPGNKPGHTSSTPSTTHPHRPDPPDHPARQGPTGTELVEKLGRPADTTCPSTTTDRNQLTKRSRDHLQSTSVDRGLVGADGLHVLKDVVKPPPAECATADLLRLDVGDAVFREHPSHLELVIVLRGIWIAEGPDGADPGMSGHVAQSVTARARSDE